VKRGGRGGGGIHSSHETFPGSIVSCLPTMQQSQWTCQLIPLDTGATDAPAAAILLEHTRSTHAARGQFLSPAKYLAHPLFALSLHLDLRFSPTVYSVHCTLQRIADRNNLISRCCLVCSKDIRNPHSLQCTRRPTVITHRAHT